MDRKGIIAVSLAIAVLIAWMVRNNQEMSKAAKALPVKVTEVKATGGVAEDKGLVAPVVAESVVVPGVPVVAERKETIKTALVEYTFSSLGGGISTALLNQFVSEGNRKMILNEFGSIPMGMVSEVAGEGGLAPFEMKVEGNVVTFDRTDQRKVQLTKKFTVADSDLPKEGYVVKLAVTHTNRGAEPIVLPGRYVYTGSAAPVHESDLATYTGFMEAGGKFINTTYFDSGWFHAERPTFTVAKESIAWAGVADQYFTTLVTQVPAVVTGVPVVKRGGAAWATRFTIAESRWTGTGHESRNSTAVRHGINGALGLSAITLAPGESATENFEIYAGPREYGILRGMKDDQVAIMDFGMFSIVSRTLLISMNWLKGVLGSYALAIIVLTLVIKSLLWPMQNKSTQSMKRMQLLQPKMTELKEKFKDDPARMNTEVMKLYKDYGVNPLSGCLPMVIQMPIFFGFFGMLGKAVELRNSKFLWVQDLSLPDTIFRIPSLGWPVNILPIVMAGTMLWQMMLSPKSGDQSQQRIMMFMPLIFIAFCYNYASALALYWTVQNLFSVAQLYLTRNAAPPTLQKLVVATKGKK
ncbi:MAG: YidC/Oxa1 family insertase periplasmic-domain containing protein [Verrucomicrobiota bacterium]